MRGKKIACGLSPSEIDGSEHIFNAEKSIPIPKSFTHIKYLPGVFDQGEKPYCVPYSIAGFLAWRDTMKHNSTNPIDLGVNYVEIYDTKTTVGDGMTYKDAFSYLRHHGVSTEEAGVQKIGEYAMLSNALALKHALIMNGPCFGALPVYSAQEKFWRKTNRFYGYHAISIIGYNEEGFIIRNSWGPSYGKDGYGILPYEEFNKLIELWTVIN